jgi:hypothetical protein
MLNQVGFRELLQCLLDQIGQVTAEAFVRCIVKVVVAWVGQQTTVEEGVRRPVDSLLSRLNSLCTHFGDEGIVQVVVQMTLDWQCLVQELLEVITLHSRQHKYALRRLVLADSASLAEHLQDFADGVVNVTVLATFEVLGALDNDKVCAAFNLPAGVARDDQHLDSTNLKQVLHGLLVERVQRLVEISDAVGEGLGKRLLVDLLKDWLDVLQSSVEESIIVVVGNSSGVEVSSR